MSAWLLWSAVRISAVLAIGLIALPLLRHRSSAFRHWLLVTTLACAAAQPLLSQLLPALTLPAPDAAAGERVTTSITLLQADGAAAAISGFPPARESGTAIGYLLLGVWLAGTLVSVASLLVGLRRLARLTSGADDAPAAWRRAAAELRGRLGLRRPVAVRVSAHEALLVTWGAARPVILLPADAAAWPHERMHAVLAHELAHVQRHDWLTQMAAEVFRAALWFHPLLWLAVARLRRESEQAADDVVLGLGVERMSYADDLVALARSFNSRRPPNVPAPAIARPSTLQRRIRAMLNAHLDRRPLSALARLAIFIVMAGASLPLAAATAQAPAGISGTLRDASGRVLPDATVRLVQARGEVRYEVQADAAGQFQLTGVQPGNYILSARLRGFSPGVETLAIAPGANLQRDLTLQVGSLEETITVTSGPGPAAAAAPPRAATAAFTAPPCTASAVGGNIKVPRKIRNVPTIYPSSAVAAGIEGKVILVAHLGVDGRVNDVRPFSQGDPDLIDAAMAAVSQWQFTPTLLNCEPIEVRMLVTTTFSATP